jgi:hypothetical protein
MRLKYDTTDIAWLGRFACLLEKVSWTSLSFSNMHFVLYPNQLKYPLAIAYAAKVWHRNMIGFGRYASLSRKARWASKLAFTRHIPHALFLRFGSWLVFSPLLLFLPSGTVRICYLLHMFINAFLFRKSLSISIMYIDLLSVYWLVVLTALSHVFWHNLFYNDSWFYLLMYPLTCVSCPYRYRLYRQWNQYSRIESTLGPLPRCYGGQNYHLWVLGSLRWSVTCIVRNQQILDGLLSYSSATA